MEGGATALRPHLRGTAGASQRPRRASGASSCRGLFTLCYNLTLGYNDRMTDVSKAASLMGRKSAEARKKKWGKKEFVRKMQEWGKLGGGLREVAKKERR